jgi:putative transposase
VFHVLNRANARKQLFTSSADYGAFVRVVQESLLIASMRILAYCLMPNHWHFVLWPERDDQLSAFMHHMTVTHVRRWHEFHHSSGQGHVYQGPFKSFPVQGDAHFYTVCRYAERNAVRAGLVARAEDWLWGSAWGFLHGDDRRALPLSEWPLPRPKDWLHRVNTALTDAEIKALRKCVERGRPFGEQSWVDDTVKKLDLEYTLRSRGRPSQKS